MTRLEDFQDLSHGAKGKWFDVDLGSSDDETVDQIFDTIQIAYAPIGGHAKYSTASAMRRQLSFAVAADVDLDPDPDAVVVGKHTGSGIKLSAIGHDGTAAGKSAALKRAAELLLSGRVYAEVSGALAHIFLTKHRIRVVQSQASVEKVLGGKVEWIGLRPDGKYPESPFWYRRKIGSESHMKILLGGTRAKMESYRVKSGRFSSPDSAHFVDHDGDRYRVVRQHRRLVPFRHDPEKWARFGDHIYRRTDFAVAAGDVVPFGGERFVRLSPRAVRSAICAFAPLLRLDAKAVVRSVAISSRTPFVLHLASREGANPETWRDVLSVARAAGYMVVLDVFGQAPVYGGREAFDRAADDGAAFLMKRG